ncbi:MAG: UDP-N-acetylmuramate:L-alanyl-gamma-D-glutamyl-meso-diaminopimelate ligase [Rhodothermales bacterium]|nr:UDP-N-acetylmuramate:L-alanyl-gamma-D-glutamyl-meso-diaminopimelate ligase [Rhodothermales bacterium]
MKDISKYPDAHLRMFERRIPASRDAVKSVHMIGICGTGMGSLAGLLKDAGYDVKGSDAAAYPPMSTRLMSMDIDVSEGFTEANLHPHPDLTIVGNACTPLHVEATYARDNDLVQMSMPEAVGYFLLHDRKPIVIAGTHGKTTTTGLVVHVLSELALDPGYLVGGVLQNSGTSYSIGHGNHFVIEGDEYDSAYFDKQPKFMHYRPFIAVVTSLEYDHVDIYDDFQDYVEAFERFAQIVADDGYLILNCDDEHVLHLGASTTAKVVTYGFSSDADIRCVDLTGDGSHQSFVVKMPDDRKFSVILPMNGKHNVMNALAAIAVAYAANQDPATVAASLKSFSGLKRRQEVVFESDNLTIIDDFAHHPTAVRETVAAIRQKYPEARLTAVFEPRSNSSRRKVFEKPYIEAFALADTTILSSPPFRHNDKKEDFMDVDVVVGGIRTQGKSAEAYEDFESLFTALTSSLDTGDVVLVMSNGGFNGIHERLIKYQQEPETTIVDARRSTQ